MILAVLEARAGITFAGNDVYLNVAGGLRITEPAADLAIAAALLSAQADISLPADAVAFGEISLSGALRPVVQPEARLKEANKLGFSSAWGPSLPKGATSGAISYTSLDDLASFVNTIFPEA
jgi:DNA repair protein RadA/Sms